MIKELRLQNWKSFADATLYVDPLTILIGANASGKSNALDALRFLQRIAAGTEVTAALAGDSVQGSIRGGVEWAALKPSTSFTFAAVIEGKTPGVEYRYHVSVTTEERCQLLSEHLVRVKYRRRTKTESSKVFLYTTDPVDVESPAITAKLYNEKAGTKKVLGRGTAILHQLHNQPLRKEITEGIEQVIGDLRRIFVLDPIPSHMRAYTPKSDQLQTDAANIAGVIAALPNDEKDTIERTLTEYVCHLPERDILRVWAEAVGKFESDAMLYCEEQWGEGHPPGLVDARGMSDGTLRFLAVLTALLTRPSGSLLVVEEVDNGVHPSRADLLVRMLREIGTKRGVDVVVTTHNPALLNALGPELIPFVVVAHRDPKSGYSRLTLLEDLTDLPKLLASGPIGRLATQGKIEEAVERAAGAKR
jgi:predicted ATPase